MDAATCLSPAQLKQDDRLHPIHLTAELFKKCKKLLKERASFAEEEGNMWEYSKAILAQNIDDEENLKQSRRACKGISKLLHYSAKSLQLIDMHFEITSELAKTTMDAVEMMSKDNSLSIETFTARFETLKIRAKNDWEIIQGKLQQSAKIDNALIALENGLNHLLRHRSLKERAEHLKKMQDDKEQLLKMEHEELLNHVTLLKLKLEMKNSTNEKLQQQFYEAEAELKNILSTDIEDLHEAIIKEKDLQQQLHACSQEYDEAMVELSKLDEQNEKIVDKERVLDEKITILKTELKNLIAFKRDDLEITSLQYKNVRENLQKEMNEKVKSLQDEIKRVQTELNCGENERTSLMMFLGNGNQDWSEEIKNTIAAGKRLEEMITAERKASAVLRSKTVEIDIECNQLELEASALHDNNNAEMMQHETEICDLQKYLDKLITEEKLEKQHYEEIRSRASITIRSAKYAYLQGYEDSSKKLNRGEVEICSLWNSTAYNPDASNFGQSLSKNDFKQDSGFQWLSTADNVTNTLFDKANIEIGMSHTVKKYDDKRIMDSEGTGKIPSDIHISHVKQTNLNVVDIINADANLGNCYPLPPSAFGSPLSTSNSPDVTTDSEISSSEFDQSVWSDFSSVVK